MSTSYELLFEGIKDSSPQTLQKVKAALVGELNFTVDEVKAFLTSVPTCILESQDSINLESPLEVLLKSGAKVSIIERIKGELIKLPEIGSSLSLDSFRDEDLEEPLFPEAKVVTSGELPSDEFISDKDSEEFQVEGAEEYQDEPQQAAPQFELSTEEFREEVQVEVEVPEEKVEEEVIEEFSLEISKEEVTAPPVQYPKDDGIRSEDIDLTLAPAEEPPKSKSGSHGSHKIVKTPDVINVAPEKKDVVIKGSSKVLPPPSAATPISFEVEESKPAAPTKLPAYMVEHEEVSPPPAPKAAAPKVEAVPKKVVEPPLTAKIEVQKSEPAPLAVKKEEAPKPAVETKPVQAQAPVIAPIAPPVAEVKPAVETPVAPPTKLEHIPIPDLAIPGSGIYRLKQHPRGFLLRGLAVGFMLLVSANFFFENVFGDKISKDDLLIGESLVAATSLPKKSPEFLVKKAEKKTNSQNFIPPVVLSSNDVVDTQTLITKLVVKDDKISGSLEFLDSVQYQPDFARIRAGLPPVPIIAKAFVELHEVELPKMDEKFEWTGSAAIGVTAGPLKTRRAGDAHLTGQYANGLFTGTVTVSLNVDPIPGEPIAASTRNDGQIVFRIVKQFESKQVVGTDQIGSPPTDTEPVITGHTAN